MHSLRSAAVQYTIMALAVPLNCLRRVVYNVFDHDHTRELKYITLVDHFNF